MTSRLPDNDSECDLEGIKEEPLALGMTQEPRGDEDLFVHPSWDDSLCNFPGDDGQCERFALTTEAMSDERHISNHLAHLGGQPLGTFSWDMTAEEVRNNPKMSARQN